MPSNPLPERRQLAGGGRDDQENTKEEKPFWAMKEGMENWTYKQWNDWWANLEAIQIQDQKHFGSRMLQSQRPGNNFATTNNNQGAEGGGAAGGGGQGEEEPFWVISDGMDKWTINEWDDWWSNLEAEFEKRFGKFDEDKNPEWNGSIHSTNRNRGAFPNDGTITNNQVFQGNNGGNTFPRNGPGREGGQLNNQGFPRNNGGGAGFPINDARGGQSNFGGIRRVPPSLGGAPFEDPRNNGRGAGFSRNGIGGGHNGFGGAQREPGLGGAPFGGSKIGQPNFGRNPDVGLRGSNWQFQNGNNIP